VALRVRVPSEAVTGQELTYRLGVENCSRAAAHHVTVKAPLPVGTRFVRATPEPAEKTPVLLWKLGTLEPCQKREIRLVVVPTSTADLRCCARVQYEHGQCVLTRVVKPGAPDLRLRFLARPTAARYDILTYKLEVQNAGRSTLQGVKLSSTLPRGLDFLNSKPSTKGDNPLTWKLGDLPSRAVRVVEYQVVAKETGRLTTSAMVEAGGDLRRQTTHTVKVGQPVLAVRKTGPAQRLVTRSATYQITVRNPGDLPATNVQLSDDLPAEMSFVSATAGGRLARSNSAESGHPQVRWDMGDIPAGGKKSVLLVVRARKAGTFKNVCTATGDRGLQEQGKAQTHFAEATGLALEIDKTTDPVEVGRETGYVLRLLNPGKVAETNITLSATVPEGLEVLAARGPGGAAEPVGGKVTFAPLASLAPGGEAVFTVRVRAEKAGEIKFNAFAVSDATGAANPVKAEESMLVEGKP
jgi:uncharacterized repeat protein (TIGR01451 family)